MDYTNARNINEETHTTLFRNFGKKRFLRLEVKERIKSAPVKFLKDKLVSLLLKPPRFLNPRNSPSVKTQYKIDQDTLIDRLKDLLAAISSTSVQDFTGIGIVVYDSGKLPNDIHMSIKFQEITLRRLKLGKDKLVNFLAEITDLSHPYHDGFVFINERSELTHVAQYFAPPIVSDVSPNAHYGNRFHTAKLGSYLEGVIATGVVSSKERDTYYFINGEEFRV